MDNPDVITARLCRSQGGVATRAQLTAAGASRHAIDRALVSGLIRQVHRGVFVHAAAPLDRRSALMAAVLAGGSGTVAARRSAAWLSELRGVPLARPEILCAREDKPLLDGVHVHRTRHLDAVDRTIVRGIPTTSVARTLLDLGGALPFEVVEVAAQDAIITRKVTVAQLVAVLERVGKRGRPGTATLRAIVAQSLPDGRLQSELEHRLHALIADLPIPAPVLQYELTLPGGRPVFLDAAWPRLKIAVEPDGRRWHADAAQVRRDNARSRAIQSLGWQHHRYGWADIVETPAMVAAELTALLGAAAA